MESWLVWSLSLQQHKNNIFSPAGLTFLCLSRSPPIAGFLDDYAFVICGLLDLYEATLRTEWLVWAEELQLRQDSLFQDEQGGGYFCSDPKDDTILLQLKEGERTPDDEEERSTLGSELISLLLIF